jgi:plastocyanin
MSQDLTDRFIASIANEQERITSRRRLIGTSALIGGGAALAMTALPTFRAAAQDALAADPYFKNDGVNILNYALTLEHLEATLYREALATFTAADFASDGTTTVYDLLTQIGEHEAAHVEALTATITDLGGTPVEEQTYDFGYSDAASFLATAAAIENVGVSAYAGAAPSVAVLAPALVPTALGIHSVEARHASFVASLINDADNQPFPDAVDAPRTPDEVLAIAGPFIVSSDAATPAATPNATPAANEDMVTVKMVDYGFEPAELKIAAGTTVTWTNTGMMPHDAAADDGSFDTGFLTSGKSATVTFTKPGTFPYICTLHPGLMKATVVVS